MTIHRPDRPNAPARVRKSALRPDTWMWRCMDKPTHHENGYPSWSDAWAAMEKHRRTVGHVRAPQFRGDPVDGLLSAIGDAVRKRGGTLAKGGPLR